LVGFSLLVLCALLSAMPLGAQTSNGSEPPSLLQLLRIAEETLTMQQTRLSERQEQVRSLELRLQEAKLRVVNLEETLKSSVGYSETLETQLMQALSSVATLETDLTETRNSLALLSARYEMLFGSWTRYREYAKSEYTRLTLQRNLWAAGCADSVVAALAAVVWAAVK